MAINIPTRTWVPIPAPQFDQGPYPTPEGGKHSRLLYDSLRQRMVLTGGDYNSTFSQDTSTAGPVIWALNLNLYPNTTWTKVKPYCVPNGEVVPNAIDNVGWTYDSNRDRYIVAGGFFQGGYSVVCSTGTPLMTACAFSPVSGVWSANPIAPPTDIGGWGSERSNNAVYDPVTDSLIKWYDDGKVRIGSFATGSWRSLSVPTGSVGVDQTIIDVVGRRVWMTDRYFSADQSATGPVRLTGVNIDTGAVISTPTLAQFGYVRPFGDGFSGTSLEAYLAFDPVNRVILIPNFGPDTYNAEAATNRSLIFYNVDTGVFEFEAAPQTVNGNATFNNCIGFNQAQNCFVMLGRNNVLRPNNSHWVYRYAPAAPDTTPPVISGVSATRTDTTITPAWTTNEPADGQVDYGLTAAYGSQSPLSTGLVLAHSLTVTGLTASTLYHYRPRSRDAAGNLTVETTDRTVTTLPTPPPPDTTPPVVTAGPTVTPLQVSADIAWTTDEPSDTQIDYGLTGAYGSSTTLNTALVLNHQQTLSGLTSATLYHYRIKSRDAAGNLFTSGDFTFTTLPATVARPRPTSLNVAITPS